MPTIEEYANRLFADWGIGKKQKDNGVLLLVAPNEREVRIEVGYGLEGTIPDGLAGDIIRAQIIPQFKANNFPKGIGSGLDATNRRVNRIADSSFEIRAEFWAATDTNSGVFVRCADPAKVGAATCYEVNIWDIRPDPKYGTGGIVDHAAVPVPPKYKAGGRWNTYEISAKGSQLGRASTGFVPLDSAAAPCPNR